MREAATKNAEKEEEEANKITTAGRTVAAAMAMVPAAAMIYAGRRLHIIKV